MGRGKIEIKKIENRTNRQVTYSKRRNGIFKKAQELTVLCDAKVSVIMFSNTGKLHEFISANTTTKKMYDQYQRALGCHLWSTHYENMQENLRRELPLYEEKSGNCRCTGEEDGILRCRCTGEEGYCFVFIYLRRSPSILGLLSFIETGIRTKLV